jgi:integrase
MPEILPLPPVRVKRKARKEATYLTLQEIDALFRVIRDTRDRAMFRLLYHRGLRASEPGRLLITDYRPGPGKPRLVVRRCKGSITAEHVLIDVEASAMKAWLRVRGVKPGALFPSRNRRPISSDMIEVLMRRYCTLAGIPRDKAHPHALKHSCATHLAVLLDGNVIEMQDHLGHADVRSTMKYLRTTQRETRADRLSEWGKK